MFMHSYGSQEEKYNSYYTILSKSELVRTRLPNFLLSISRCTEQNSSINFIKLFKRQLQNKMFLQNLRNFSEQNTELLKFFHESSVFCPENLSKFYITLFRNRVYPRLLNSSIKLIELCIYFSHQWAH